MHDTKRRGRPPEPNAKRMFTTSLRPGVLAAIEQLGTRLDLKKTDVVASGIALLAAEHGVEVDV